MKFAWPVGGPIAAHVPLAAAAAGLALVAFGLTVQPTSATDPSTFVRIEKTGSTASPERVTVLGDGKAAISATLHRSTGTTDRGEIRIEMVPVDPEVSPVQLRFAAAEGHDPQVGHTYPIWPDNGPTAHHASCDAYHTRFEELEADDRGQVTRLAMQMWCRDTETAYSVRINSSHPYAAATVTVGSLAPMYPRETGLVTITVASTGTEPLVVQTLGTWYEYYWHAPTPHPEFDIEREDCTGAPVPSGAACEIVVRISPIVPATYALAEVIGPSNTAAGWTGTQLRVDLLDSLTVIDGLEFDDQPGGSRSAPYEIPVTVNGPVALSFRPARAAVAVHPIEVVGDTCAQAPVEPGHTCVVSVVFVPQHPGINGASLFIEVEGRQPRQIQLWGHATDPITAPGLIEFGYRQPGGRYSKTFAISSLADVPVSVSRVTLTEDVYGPALEVESETCTQEPVPPRGSCTISLAFSPPTGRERPQTYRGTVSFEGPGPWHFASQTQVTGVGRTPNPGVADPAAPVVTITSVTAANPTEGSILTVRGRYEDPNGYQVILRATIGTIRNVHASPTPIPASDFSWTLPAGDGPRAVDVTITASNAGATSPPQQFHWDVANVAPHGSIVGDSLVPIDGVAQVFTVGVGDAGNDLQDVEPMCGLGSVVSLTEPDFWGKRLLRCAFSVPGPTTVGVTATDHDGAATAVLMATEATPQVKTLGGGDATLTFEGSPHVAGGVLAALDFDGDGRDELVVGSRRYAGGYVGVLLETPSGTAPLAEMTATPHGFRILPPDGSAEFGTVVANAGDINGDGVEDLAIADAGASTDGCPGCGSAWIIFGGHVGADIDLGQLDPALGMRITGEWPYARLGVHVAGGGDVNRDGFDDIVITALHDPDLPDGLAQPGLAFVVFGSATPVSLDLGTPSAGRWAKINGYERVQRFAQGAAIADLDGDGYADVALSSGGAPSDVFIFWGRATFQTWSINDPDPARWVAVAGQIESSSEPAAWLGETLASGDVNGDGLADLVATAGGQGHQRLAVINGSRTRSFRPVAGVRAAELLWTGTLAMGDVNGDGRDDVAMRTGRGETKVARLVSGAQLAGDVSLDSTQYAWWRIDGPMTDGRPDGGLAIGDLDGDHVDDLVVSDPGSVIDIRFGSRDTMAPVVATTQAGFSVGSTTDGTSASIRLAWVARDLGTGIRTFTVDGRKDAGAFRRVTTTRGRAIVTSLRGLHSLQWRVRAQDWAGNRSSLKLSPEVRAAFVSSKAARWTGSWKTAASPPFRGARGRWSTRAGASATFTFTGRAVAWIGRRSRDGGAATIFVDGVRVGLVSLRSSRASLPTVLFSKSWASSGRHVVRIVVTPNAKGARVQVDGFGVLR